MQEARENSPLTARRVARVVLFAAGAGTLAVLFSAIVAAILDGAGYTLSTDGEFAVRLALLGLFIGLGQRYFPPRSGLRG
jgi:hypothetical protein